MSGPGSNTGRLLSFFRSHPGETFHAAEISKETGVNRGSLGASFQVLQRKDSRFVAEPGGYYRYQVAKPSKPSKPIDAATNGGGLPSKVFELIGGPTSTGELVLQSAGDLYLARKL